MEFSGKVIYGAGMGRKLGFPTANLNITSIPNLESGIYFVKTFWKGKKYNGLLHYGVRKTLDLISSVEVHILDFDQNIYGEILTVKVLKFHRKSIKFKSLNELISAMKIDEIKGRKFFIRMDIFKAWETLSHSEIQEMGIQTVKKISTHKKFLVAKNVYLYAPIKYEIPFVKLLIKQFPEKIYFFPKIMKISSHNLAVNQIKFYPSIFKNLKVGKFGILEPTIDENITSSHPQKIKPDIIFVPAVAVDKNLNRLGRGGGFYDRWLSLEKGFTVSVLPNFAYVKKLPIEAHDKSVHEIIILKR